jgi:hypothetical protein
MNRGYKVTALVALVILLLAVVGSFTTQGIMEYLPFLHSQKGGWSGESVSHGSWVRLRRTGGRVQNYGEIALADDVTSTEAYAYGVDEVVFSSWGTKLLCDEQGGAQK